MNPNPFLGVFFHWLGGLASGSFYVPYRGVKKWSWETYWLVGGMFVWIIYPRALAFLMTNDLAGRFAAAKCQHTLVDLFFRIALGIRRTHVRFDAALSRHVAGNGRGARMARRLERCCHPSSRLSCRICRLERASLKSQNLPPARSCSPEWAFVCSALESRRWRV